MSGLSAETFIDYLKSCGHDVDISLEAAEDLIKIWRSRFPAAVKEGLKLPSDKVVRSLFRTGKFRSELPRIPNKYDTVLSYSGDCYFRVLKAGELTPKMAGGRRYIIESCGNPINIPKIPTVEQCAREYVRLTGEWRIPKAGDLYYSHLLGIILEATKSDGANSTAAISAAGPNGDLSKHYRLILVRTYPIGRPVQQRRAGTEAAGYPKDPEDPIAPVGMSEDSFDVPWEVPFTELVQEQKDRDDAITGLTEKLHKQRLNHKSIPADWIKKLDCLCTKSNMTRARLTAMLHDDSIF